MKRLTKDNYSDDCLRIQNERNQLPEYKTNHYSQGQYNADLWNKVKATEDIEDKLGINLEILQKAKKQLGIYVKNCFGEITSNEIASIDLYCDRIVYYIQYQPEIHHMHQEFKDYGKTWALTREELEDDKIN